MSNQWPADMTRHIGSPSRSGSGQSTPSIEDTRRLAFRAGYDAARTNAENRKHWASATAYDANVEGDPLTRAQLRFRTREEERNNCYLQGLVWQTAVDLVGTGPRLQLEIPGVGRDVSRAIELPYANWSRVADYPEDLRILVMTRLRDGEGFGVMIDNPVLLESELTGVSLDLNLYETDQVSDPTAWNYDPLYVDGIRRDRSGNVIEYTFLEHHPGSLRPGMLQNMSKIPGRSVVHWYNPTRPNQARGIPIFAAALAIFSQLRRYTLATLTAAEMAAMLAGVLHTDQPPDGSGPIAVSAMEEIELARGMLLTLPAGWEAKQFEAKQPVAGYKEFKAEALNEAGRAASLPRNLTLGNSSEYNYSSGRLDHLPYQRSLRVERSRLRTRVLDRIFVAWVNEAALARVIPPSLPPISTWRWDWHYDGFDSIDPVKDAQADEIELRNGTTTFSQIYARKGKDWEEQLRQRARERDLCIELGLPVPGENTAGAVAAPAAPGSPPAGPMPAAPPDRMDGQDPQDNQDMADLEDPIDAEEVASV